VTAQQQVGRALRPCSRAPAVRAGEEERKQLDRETNESTRGLTIWLTGLPSAGKTTLGRNVAQRLLLDGEAVELLDGDVIRSKIGRELGFSRRDREDNLRRISFVADLLARNGITVVVAAISPYSTLRREIRSQLSPFLEVFVNAPLLVCERRDVKGLYRRCRNGEIKGLTGVDDVYERPFSPEVECRTDLETVEESVAKVLAAIRIQRGHSLVDSPDALREVTQ
jgi:adenylylsulfate kinase